VSRPVEDEHTLLAEYADAIAALPPGTLARDDLLVNDFLLDAQGRLRVYYAPFEHVNAAARVAVVGLRPGWQQLRLAFEAARDALRRGDDTRAALRAAAADAAFAGMRRTLCRMLDELGLPARLGLDESAALFTTHASLLHTTSALRFPVFVGDEQENYSGSPSPARNPFLLAQARVFMAELEQLGDAIVVPLGKAVADALRAVGVPAARCLYGFPHPSGANGHRTRLFAAARERLRAQVATL